MAEEPGYCCALERLRLSWYGNAIAGPERGNMRLEQLEYFVAAAEAGSISGAAQRLKVSQPAVSAALKSLEEELGGRLFSRGNQGISLTPLGRLTCDDARKMLELARGMLVRGRNAGVQGAAQVCAQPLLSFHLTGNIIVPFRELHPNIDVFMRNVPNADIVAELKSGRCGIAVTLVALGLKIKEQSLGMGCGVVPLYTDVRRMFIGAGHPLAAREKLTPEDLQSLRIAYYSHGADTVSRLYAPYFGGEYRLANREDILDLVLRNEAVFIQAGRMFRRDYRVEKGMMVEREIPLPDIDHSAPIVAIRAPELSPAETLLWEYLIAHFSDGL